MRYDSFIDQASMQTVSQECIPGIECNSACNSIINGQQSTLGCCFYTLYSLTFGTEYTNSLLSSCGAETMTCNGGFSGEPIPLPTMTASDGYGSGDQSYDNICSNGIPQECHNYLELQNIELFAAANPAGFVSSFCDGECADC